MSKKKIIFILLVLVFSFTPLLAGANPPGPTWEDENPGITLIFFVVAPFVVTIIIECLVGLLVLKLKKYEAKKALFVASVALANVISYPIFVLLSLLLNRYIFPVLNVGNFEPEHIIPAFLILIGLELLVVLLESFISWRKMKMFLSFSKIMFIIFVNNLVTCILGLVFWNYFFFKLTSVY